MLFDSSGQYKKKKATFVIFENVMNLRRKIVFMICKICLTFDLNLI